MFPKQANDALHMVAWSEALMFNSERLEFAHRWQMPMEEQFRLHVNASRMWLEKAWDEAIPAGGAQ